MLFEYQRRCRTVIAMRIDRPAAGLESGKLAGIADDHQFPVNLPFFRSPNTAAQILFITLLLLLDRNVSQIDSHFGKLGGGIQEMRRQPKYRPPFGISSAQFPHVAHVALLCEICMLDLFSQRT